MTDQEGQQLIDYSALYELSLTIGASLDFYQSCKLFLYRFTNLKCISFASIWSNQHGIYKLVEASDNCVSTIKIDDSVFSNATFFTCSNKEELFEQIKHQPNIKTGTYSFYKLSNIGCIQFYIKDISRFSKENWQRLEPVLKQLATYLQNIQKSKLEEGKVSNILKQRKGKLARHLNITELVADNLLEGLIITNEKNQIRFVNQKMCQLTGYQEHELLDKKAYQTLMPKEEWDYIEGKLALADKTQLRGYLERKGVRKDGSTWWGLMCNAPLINENDEFLGMLITVVDITNRKNTEKEKNKLVKALSESENKYRRVVQNLSEGVIMTDLEDKVTFVNQQMCDLTGYIESEIIGQKAYELLLPKEEWQSSEKRLEEREDGISENYVKLHLRKDGSTWWGSINASPLMDENGNIIGTLAAVMNVTKRIEVEQEREALVAELAEKNKDLDDFAYIVSHDLKAPLRSIKTLSEWIYQDYAEVLDEDGQYQMKLLQNRVTRMHQFIESLLEFSRLGHTKVQEEAFDLNESVLQIIDSFQPLEDFDIKIKTKLPTIVGEKVRIEQVFQNLISNGMKYNDKPKGLIEISHQENEEYYTFDVTDNGKGIDKKYFEKIFQIFQTLEARDSYESTGVGLTIVKKIVESHDGKITLKSELGKGTSFIFTLKKRTTKL